MMPDPVPPESALVALIVTTLGVAFCAAAVTALTLSGLLTITGVNPTVCAATAAGEDAFKMVVAPATVPPPRRPAASMQAMRPPAPIRFLAFGAEPPAGPAVPAPSPSKL